MDVAWSFVCLSFFASLLSHVAFAILVEEFTDLPSISYDFIIVGGGLAGSVVANRLTENPRFKVLVIEAGPTNEGVLNSMVPAYAFGLQQTPYDWNYTTVPQSGLNNRIDILPRGFMLGGSSSINGMFYTRGSSDEYDRWANVTGDPGWSWKNLLPYILKSEKWSIPSDHHNVTGQYDPDFHSVYGMTSVSLTGVPTASDAKFFEASEELGGEFAFDVDMNDGTPLGISWLQSTIGNGTRSSAAVAYLGPDYIIRPNLHVVVDHRVVRLLETAGIGEPTPAFRTVAFVKGNNTESVVHHVTASKEVILCGGAYGSPQVLMLSGIGDPVDLVGVGVRPIVDLPSVGKNLSEHVQFATIWNLGIPDTVDPQSNQTYQEEALAQWWKDRSGPLTSLGVNVLSWLRLPDDWPFWDRFEDPTAGKNSPHIELIPLGGGAYPVPGRQIIISPVVASPHSRGTVKLKSNHPFDKPLIDPKFFDEEYDLYALAAGYNATKRLLSASTWAEYKLQMVFPFAGPDSDVDIYEVLRNVAGHGAHPVGTAMMSHPDATYGVVNPDLKVKNVSGLRIVDASIMPYLIQGHTQAPTYAIAERGADLIKASWPDDGK